MMTKLEQILIHALVISIDAIRNPLEMTALRTHVVTYSPKQVAAIERAYQAFQDATGLKLELGQFVQIPVVIDTQPAPGRADAAGEE